MRDALLVVGQLVTRMYGSGQASFAAVAEADFTVEPGQHVAIVGPSGSGKSTLLHLIAGLDEPTSGAIRWPSLGDRDVLRPGPVAVAFQGPSLLPPLTVAENVELPTILSGDAGDERSAEGRTVAELLELFEVSELAGKLPEEISGGQSQRVGLARAFMGLPRLVLVDEPTGQQDRATAARVLDTMLEIAARDGIALVVATHDEMVAGRMSLRWSMQAGRLFTEAVGCSA